MKSVLVRFGYTVGLLIAGFYVVLTLRGPNGIPRVIERRRIIREVEEQNADLARQNQLLRERNRRLASSPTEQELEIRRRFKYSRPGDTVFIITGEDPTPSTPAAH
jgi:cell division protein FtsB